MTTALYEYEDQGGRRTSAAIFLVLTALLVTAFSVIPLPSQDYADRAVEVIMLERMDFQSLVDVVREDEEESEEEDNTPEPEEMETIEEQPQFQDLALMMEVFKPFSYSDAEIDETALLENTVTEAPSVLAQGELDLEVGGVLGEFTGRDLDLTSNLVTRDDDVRSTRTLSSGLFTDRVSGRSRPDFRRVTGSRDGEGLEFRDQGRNAPDLLETTRTEVQPEKRELDFTFTVPVNKLAEWMKLNQGPLDPGIRSHFRYSGHDLTTSIEISVEGKTYGLQLMHTPGTGAMHIALLDGNAIFYFIDAGTQGRANYFHKGRVRRDGDEALVMLVESEDLSPRGPEALRFFDVFLAWWEEEEDKIE